MASLIIGTATLDQTAALAPMASVADQSYRVLCKEQGASFVVSEMVSAKGLCYSDRKSEELMWITPSERPMAIQLFGSEPYFMCKALEKVLPYRPDWIDINMGCPVPKVTKTGSGSALMETPDRAEEIVASMVQQSPVPITVKIRKCSQGNTIDFAKRMEAAGAAAITVHGRTRAQMYHGQADWNIIQGVKNAVTVPVIGNGDIQTAQDAKRLYQQTGVDLAMVGRGSYGRPWIFAQIKTYLETGVCPADPPLDAQMAILLRHMQMLCEHKGEKTGIMQGRAQAMRYIKDIPHAAKWRAQCAQLTSYHELDQIVSALLAQETC